MVWGVCRGALNQVQDAEDAFQATFLALARKAGSLRHSASVGGWLYRVASRTAVHARTTNAHRRANERSAGHLPDVAVAPVEPQDWQVVLHQEIAGLPDIYRQALVLCELEGKSRREGARLLGVPEGTLSSRLAAARRLLGERLVRRGLALAVAVPDALAAATLKAVTGQWDAAPAAAALAKGVLKAMFVSKFKSVVAVSALVVLLGAGAFTCSLGGRETEPAKATDDPTAQPDVKKTQDAEAEKALREEAEALRRQNERLQLELRKAKEEQAVLMARLEERLLALKVADADKERRLRDALRALDTALVQLDALKDQTAKLKAELDVERKRRQELEDELRRLRSRDPAAEAEEALKEFREVKDKEAKRKALNRLQQALDRLKEDVK
jgi:RNA polymerase sigma factor (sigma-70 family)